MGSNVRLKVEADGVAILEDAYGRNAIVERFVRYDLVMVVGEQLRIQWYVLLTRLKGFVEA